jgi:hypothetical protein
MRRPFATAVVLALVVLAAAAALDDRDVAFETGLPAFDHVARVAPGPDVCVGDVDVPAGFQRVRFVVGTMPQVQPLRVTLTDEAGGRRVGEGQFPGGEPSRGGNVEVSVGDVPAGGRLEVCAANEGAADQRFFGSPPNRDATQPPRLAVVFVREPPATMLSLIPDAVERSALFKPGWYGPWTTWLLLGAAALVVPFLLSRALSAAYASDRSYSSVDSEEDRSERSS